MKRKVLVISLMIFCFLFTACLGKKQEKSQKESSGIEKNKIINLCSDDTISNMTKDIIKDYNLNGDKKFILELKILKKEEAVKEIEESKDTTILIGYSETGLEKKYEKEPIGKDGIGFIVDKNNPLESINVEQLRNLYSGKITYWKDLKFNIASNYGKEQITPISYNKDLSLQKEFENKIMNTPTECSYSNKVIYVSKILDALSEVKEKKSIGYILGQNYTDGFKMLKLNGVKLSKDSITSQLYPLTITINIFYDKSSKDSFEKISEYLKSDEGKKVIKKYCSEVTS